MLRFLCLTLAGTVLGSFALSPLALAQTVNVPFNGTVPGVCTVGQITPGVLAYSTIVSGLATLTSFANLGGVPAAVPVTCNGGVTIRVDGVSLLQSPDNAPDPPGSGWYAEIINPSTNQYATRESSGSSLTAPLAPGSYTLPVNMQASRLLPNNPYAPGNYQYEVQFTLVP
ncbi:hypothetical protein [Trichothermofontia sp.]